MEISQLLAIILAIVAIVGLWKMVAKAGYPGWYSIIPILNTITFIKMAGRPVWWIFLCLVPFVNAIISFILCIDTAKRFGKDTGFGVGLALLPFIFAPILGFSDDKYQVKENRPEL